MKIAEWCIVYHKRDLHFWFLRWVKPGFQHVELARPIHYGPSLDDVGWIYFKPVYEMIEVDLSTDPRPPWVRFPDSTVQNVTAVRPHMAVRSWFDFGPPTCVEAVKWALGIRAFFVRTPWQLFQYIHKRGGVIVNGRRRRQ